MKRIIVFVLLLSLAGQLSAFTFRTESVWSAEKYQEYTHETFTGFDPFHQTINPDDMDLPLLHAAVFYLTNKERRQRGLAALAWSLNLETAAFHHSRVMKEYSFFAHRSRLPGRHQPEERARLAGVQNPKIAENIANSFLLRYEARRTVHFRGPGQFSYSGGNGAIIGYHTYLSLAEALVLQWMNSSGHRANILSTKAYELGVGIYPYVKTSFNQMPSFYATQNFQWFYPVEAGESSDPLPPGWGGE